MYPYRLLLMHAHEHKLELVLHVLNLKVNRVGSAQLGHDMFFHESIFFSRNIEDLLNVTALQNFGTVLLD